MLNGEDRIAHLIFESITYAYRYPFARRGR